MAVCHTVVIDSDSGDYQSESPDEEALVKAAASLGWVFVSRGPGKVVIRSSVTGEELTFEILLTIPFDSTRKRMSVLVRQPNGAISVYCKGADNIMFERANQFAGSGIGAAVSASTNASAATATSDDGEEGKEGQEEMIGRKDGEIKKTKKSTFLASKEVMEGHLREFGSEGLRTLVLGKRDLTSEAFASHYAQYAEAQRSGDPKQKEILLQSVFASIERDFEIIGATAIEDKLQDGVPETIEELSNAGVKLWVLTGDKLETAINIGYSSRLLGPEMALIRLENKPGETPIALKRKLRMLVNRLKLVTEDENMIYRIWSSLQNTIRSIVYAGSVDSDADADLGDGLNAADLDDEFFHSFGVGRGVSGNGSESVGRGGSGSGIGGVGGSRRRKDGHSEEGEAEEEEEGSLLHGASTKRDLDRLQTKQNSSSSFSSPHPPIPTPPTTNLHVEDLTSDHLALIVDGDTLLKIFGDDEAEALLLTLCRVCKAVIACRVSPEQKRLIVRLVKRGISPRPVTLSIGDGANDVAMIQEAQIGIELVVMKVAKLSTRPTLPLPSLDS
jgi:magnesium-transporting ATPase (P-type)